MPFCPTCRKVKRWLGAKLIGLGTRLYYDPTVLDPHNFMIKSYDCAIDDQRKDTKYAGHVILYGCTKTMAVVQDKDSFIAV